MKERRAREKEVKEWEGGGVIKRARKREREDGVAIKRGLEKGEREKKGREMDK